MNLTDMQKFCDTTDVRFYYTRPFPIPDGRIVATDGKVIVAFDGGIEIDAIDISEKSMQTLQKYIAPELFVNGFVPLQVEIGDYPICTQCDGTGKLNKKTECKECDGEGEFYYNGHWYDCKECDGSGETDDHSKAIADKVDCENCGGTGKGFYPVKIDSRFFQAKYLEKLLILPNIEYLPSDDALAAMKFRFTGGVGFLMPVRV